ncbi:hypothetical protein FBUS_08669 [Fasciolopsis buskii]|uniref:Elongator complex protein 2 n=1 Tax=Fasciolopsis buskii TaxID=27845 RepID=A0A8E0VLJ6_9TREM|nr:hypothetical protein FBUS_08669 [Fasciolopsis buski]
MTATTDILDNTHTHQCNDSIRCVYTSACVNHRSGCISVLPLRTTTSDTTSVLAFGSSHAICLSVGICAELDSPDGSDLQSIVPMFRIFEVLHGHDAPVVAVRWISSSNVIDSSVAFRLLASLDATGKLLLWCCHVNDIVLTADPVISSCCHVVLDLHLPNGCTPSAVDGCMVTSRTDSHPDLISFALDVTANTALYSWHTHLSVGADRPSVVYTSDPVIVQRKPAMCLCIRSVCWPLMAQCAPSTSGDCSLHMMFVGLDNGNIEVWVEHIPSFSVPTTTEPRKFIHSATLFGHTDWVRCLDICTKQKGFTPSAFLVSGSQDHIIRIWRLYGPDSHRSFSEENRSTLKVRDLSL